MPKEEIKLKIHGHSCLEIRDSSTRIIFDPWLNGSAYWRSWWNFPEPYPFECFLEEISQAKNIYVYITHLHWDHFHAPTLKKIIKTNPSIKFLIPRVPEPRLKNDLISILGKKTYIIEINHSKKFNLSKSIYIQPFLSGPVLTDSAVLIKCNNDYILNLNDSKQQSLMIKQIKSFYLDGKLKIMLRSHSSANSRICQYNLDGSIKTNTEKEKDDYSRDFLEAARIFKPELSIPFASNMCYLHKDTYKYNSYSNTSDQLECFYKNTKEYKDINLKLLLPCESITLQSMEIDKDKNRRFQLYSNREEALKLYRSKYFNKINKAELFQSDNEFSEKLFNQYFTYIFSSLPFFLRSLVKGKVAFVENKEINCPKIFIIDMAKAKIIFGANNYNDCLTVIIIRPGVLNSALAQKNFNSLGISKLLEIRTSSSKQYNLFSLLCIAVEIGTLPTLSFKQMYRSFTIWITRWREFVDYLMIIFKFKSIIGNYKSR